MKAIKNRDIPGIMSIMREMPHCDHPEELVIGMEGLLQKIGRTSSFMEPNDDHDRMDTGYLWNVIIKGILNP